VNFIGFKNRAQNTPALVLFIELSVKRHLQLRRITRAEFPSNCAIALNPEDARFDILIGAQSGRRAIRAAGKKNPSAFADYFECLRMKPAITLRIH
jgi:hypothetical protein